MMAFFLASWTRTSAVTFTHGDSLQVTHAISLLYLMMSIDTPSADLSKNFTGAFVATSGLWSDTFDLGFLFLVGPMSIPSVNLIVILCHNNALDKLLLFYKRFHILCNVLNCISECLLFSQRNQMDPVPLF